MLHVPPSLEGGGFLLGGGFLGGDVRVGGELVEKVATGLKAESPFPFCTATLIWYLVLGWRSTTRTEVVRDPFTVKVMIFEAVGVLKLPVRRFCTM